MSMARKTKAEAAITREQLLDAAERVFRAHGVSSTSLGEVASAAGVTRGAVYWHFRDKADLLAALCERTTLPLDVMFETNCGCERDPWCMLRTMAVAALTHLARDARAQAMFQLVFQTCGSADELAPLASAQVRERGACLERTEQLVQLAIDAAQLPADTDAALVAQSLHAYVMGLMQAWVQNPAAYDLAAAAPALVDSLLAGLRASPPRSTVPREPEGPLRGRTPEPEGRR
jgi:TetR/AcrR family acrAB operon transcriptional repressor